MRSYRRTRGGTLVVASLSPAHPVHPMKTLLFALSLAVCMTTAWSEESASPLRVALYDGPGSAGKGIPRITELLSGNPGFQLTKVKPDQITTVTRDRYDVVIFTGGSGSGQSKAIGEKGIQTVKTFVEQGGGYVGICAGAYLACSGFSWGAKVLDSKTVSPKWKRGVGMVEMQLTPEGKAILGDYSGAVQVKYANGPIVMPFGDEKMPDYKPLSLFASELAENGSPVGVMKGAPAIAAGDCGQGRVVAISPHPEQTPGLDEMVRNAIRWTGRRPPVTPTN